MKKKKPAPRRTDAQPRETPAQPRPKLRRPVLAATALLLTGGLLAGCTAVSQASGGTTGTTVAATASAFSGDLSTDQVLAANADYTTVNDDEWSESDAVDIALSGSSASSDGASGNSGAVEVSGSTVTITEAGVYRLSGSLDGQVVVAAPDDAQVVLILDDAEIDNAEGAAIDIQSADDAAIYLVEGSINSVSDAASYADDEQANAAINASSDLTISGSGSLTVQGNGNDGISSTDDLVILSGDLTVTAADDALRGKDALVVEGGSLTLTATGGDGLKSDQEDDETQGYVLISGGTVEVTAGDDAVQGRTDVIVTDGELTLNAPQDHGIVAETVVAISGGSIAIPESREGVQAISIGIAGGTIGITASDDGINAAGINTGGQDRETDTGERLEVTGGTITIDAVKDGFDSNGTITVSGGDITITSADNGGDGPLDANGEISVTGVTIMANGSEWDAATADRGPGGGQGGGAPSGGQPPGQ